MSSCENSKFTIIKGSDVVIDILLKDESFNLYDLTDVDEVSVWFKNQDGTNLEKTLVAGVTIVSPPVNGKISVTLTDAETLLLKEGKNENTQVNLTTGTNTKIINIPKSLEVIPSLF